MIQITVNKTCARLQTTEPLTSGMIGKQMQLVFDSSWNGLRKTAVFSDGKNAVSLMDSFWDGNTITIPHEVLSEDGRTVTMGVYGYKVNGDETILAIPSVYAELGKVRKGADPEADPTADPTLPVYAQLDLRVTDLEEHGGGSDLPEVTEADNGKVLKVINGEWDIGDDERGGAGTGWTDEQIDLLEAVFAKLVYTDAEGGAIAAQLINSLRGGVVPEEPITITFDGTKAVISGLGNTTITYSGTTAKIGYMPL